MSRTKGSKNKLKDSVKKTSNGDLEVIRDGSKGVVHKEPFKEEKAKPVGHSVAVVESYQPKPDMGDIKPPPESKTICKCGHEKEFHYGGQYGHCNRPSCQCLKFS